MPTGMLPDSSRRMRPPPNSSGGLWPALQKVSNPLGVSTALKMVAYRDSTARRVNPRLTVCMISAGVPVSAPAPSSPWIFAVSRAAAGPLPETSPTAKPKLPSGRGVKSKKSPPMDRDGNDAPIAS